MAGAVGTGIIKPTPVATGPFGWTIGGAAHADILVDTPAAFGSGDALLAGGMFVAGIAIGIKPLPIGAGARIGPGTRTLYAGLAFTTPSTGIVPDAFTTLGMLGALITVG